MTATPKQISYLRALMAEVYTADEIDAYIARGLTKRGASAAIQKMLDAGYGKTTRRATTKATTRRRSYSRREDFDIYADMYGEGAAFRKFGMGRL